MNLKNKENPPITNYLGIDFKTYGLETLNDSFEKNKLQETTKLCQPNNTLSSLNVGNQFSEMIITVDPTNCTPWKFADRDEAEMGDISSLGLSIKNNGQQEPVLLRRKINPENQTKEYEIIFGRRRWKACIEYGLQLKAIIKQMSDQEAAVAQKEENENRENISDYSRAFYYKKLLDEKVFDSVSILAKKMNAGKSTILDMLSYTRIDKKILDAMPNPHKLSKAAATKLATLSNKINLDCELNALIFLAPKIQEGKITFRNIENEFNKKLLATSIDAIEQKSIFSSSGIKLFMSKKKSNGDLVLLINKNIINSIKADKIENILFDFITKEYNFNINSN